MRPLVLSLFPGIGLLDRAFEAEGFCIVRGPDAIWGGDIRDFHPPAGVFDGIIGGPPCQLFSVLRTTGFQPHAGERFGNLIPEYERVVNAVGPGWFVMEEVPGAPIPRIPGYCVYPTLMRDDTVGGESRRARMISFGSRSPRRFHVETLALYRPDPVRTAVAGHNYPQETKREPLGDLLAAQGFPRDLLDDCPFTMDGKRKAVGNGVPFAMGRAIARAVKAAIL